MAINNKNQERKLAAIMFTDMVGYSALAQEDEVLSLVLLEEHRVILRQIFPIHGGTEIETIGDAFLVEFSSALDAVNCAIDIQKELWERNKYEPIKEHIKIRIGIHLGDVVHKEGNVLGDGVNIAARIEPLARSCGICVSEDIARQVRNKINYPLKKLHPKQLKNIQTPVELYDVALHWLQDEAEPRSPRKRNKLHVSLLVSMAAVLFLLIGYVIHHHFFIDHHPQMQSQWENSIAVLPFSDFSPQKDQDYFCDGMTDQILTNLAQLERLKVIARTSVMKFKSTVLTIPEIGDELNVEHILEGSIQKFGDRIKITVQLVRSADGAHLWAQVYERDYTDLFAIQDEISRSIADKLSEKLSTHDIDAIKTRHPNNIEAYEYYLKAEYIHKTNYWSAPNAEYFKEAEQMFLKAIDIDPTYASAYAGLADLYNTYWNTLATGEEEKNRYLELQEQYINTAYDLDPESAKVNRVMGWVYSAQNKTKEKIEFMKKAVELEPNDPENIQALGISYYSIGLLLQALEYYARCIELDPADAKYYYYRANAFYYLGDFEHAKPEFHHALKLEPNDPRFLMFYILLLLEIDENTEAQRQLTKYNHLYPNTEYDRFLKAMFHAKNGDREKALAIELSEAQKLVVYLSLKMEKEALSLLRKDYKQDKMAGKTKYLHMRHHPQYDFLRSNPNFLEILDGYRLIYENNLIKFVN